MATLKSLVNETTNIKNELIECYSNLKSNLIQKEVECSEDDKFSSLIEKINEISVGRKWASGEDTLSHKNTGVYKLYSKTINNLEFVPSLVFCYSKHLFGDASVNYLKGVAVSNLGYLSMYMANASANIVISDNSFTLNVSTQGNVGSLPFTWYAFE